MEIKKNRFLVILLVNLISLAIAVTPVHAVDFTLKKLKIGAKLKAYRIPNKDNCDIRVPKQYSTIQAGIEAANSGDLVCVAKGNYDENVLVNKSIMLSGKGAVRIEADNVIIEGFEINGVGTDQSNGALRIAESVSEATVRYNHIIAGAGELVLLTDGFQNNHLIQNNVLEGNNSPQIALVNGQPSTGKPSDSVDFLYNTFIGTVQSTGVVLIEQATNSSIKYNVFDTSGTANEIIQNSYSSENTGVNYNNFHSFAQLWKVSNGVGVLNAEDNWWGDTDPSDDIRNNMVDFTPFATKPYKEN